VTYFDFLPDVREVLLGTITRSDAIAVNELVQQVKLDAQTADSELASAEPNLSSSERPASFGALLTAAQGSTGLTLTSADESYAAIETQVLRRVGGRYAEVVTGEVPLPRSEAKVRPAWPPREPIERFTPDLWRSPLPGTVGEPSRADTTLGNEYGITMLGAPDSGKTTFLAALPVALTRGAGDWRVIGADTPSTEMLLYLTRRLTLFRDFPHATSDVELYRWMLYGQFSGQAVRPRRRARPSDERAEVGLRLADAMGEIASDVMVHKSRGNLVDTLEKSRGIIYLFDPVRQNEDPNAFDHIFGVLEELATRMKDTPYFARHRRLQHHIAICLSKFDQPKLLEAAANTSLLSVDPDDLLQLPRIHEEDARKFFVQMSNAFQKSDIRRVLRTFESWFEADRIKYFATSAIGFYIDPEIGIYNRADYQNQLPATHHERIRGPVRPINVAEPMLWLSEALWQSRQSGRSRRRR
jgi:hypothetical protein